MSLNSQQQNINKELVDAIFTPGIKNLFKFKKGN